MNKLNETFRPTAKRKLFLDEDIPNVPDSDSVVVSLDPVTADAKRTSKRIDKDIEDEFADKMKDTHEFVKSQDNREKGRFFLKSPKVTKASQLEEAKIKPSFGAKDSFTLSTETPDGDIVDSNNYTSIGSLKKNVAKITDDKNKLAKSGVSVVSVIRNTDNKEMFLIMQDENGRWETYVNLLDDYQEMHNGDIFKKVYAELVRSEDKNAPKSPNKYSYNLIGTNGKDIFIRKTDDINFDYAKKVADKYGLTIDENPKDAAHSIAIILPGDEPTYGLKQHNRKA